MQSVVIYWPETEPKPTCDQMNGLHKYFGTRWWVERCKDIPPHDHIVITPRHAHKQAQAAGAQYMGREFALKKAGLL